MLGLVLLVGGLGAAAHYGRRDLVPAPTRLVGSYAIRPGRFLPCRPGRLGARWPSGHLDRAHPHYGGLERRIEAQRPV